MEINRHTKKSGIGRLLIANRGEIVARILKTCEKLAIEVVLVYSQEDKNFSYLQEAKQSLELPGESLEDTYLNQDLIIDLAKKAKVDAIHPGYGFLSENADFAQKCINNDLIWIGPDPSIMRRMADKTQARKLAQNINIPTVPAFSGTKERLIETLTKEDLPILLKAAAGGGGRGMRIVNTVDELDQQIDLAAREAKLAFGDGRLFIEKYLDKAKHIEVQILGDNHGNHIHLFERECTIQRRYQKIIEESPSTSISSNLRDKLTSAAIELAKAAAYNNAGTVEFLVDPQGAYYFIETNARIQVEHPVTEMVTGIDMIEQQIRIAENLPLQFKQDDIQINGHALECRICAESPEKEFNPSPGKLSLINFPDTPNKRLDTAINIGSEITTSYDSLIAKLIVHKTNRQEAIDSMTELLKKTALFGIDTNIPYLIEILDHPDYRNNNFYTSFIKTEHNQLLRNLSSSRANGLKDIAVGSYALLELQNNQVSKTKTGNPWKDSGYWRTISTFRVIVDDQELFYEFEPGEDDNILIKGNDYQYFIKCIEHQSDTLVLEIDSRRSSIIWNRIPTGIELSIEGSNFKLANPLTSQSIKKLDQIDAVDQIQVIPTPLPGKLSRILVEVGDLVAENQPLAIIESMKIENQILARKSGRIIEINFEEGKHVKMKECLMKIETN